MKHLNQTTAMEKQNTINNDRSERSRLIEKRLPLIIAVVCILIVRLSLQENAKQTHVDSSELRWRQPDQASLTYSTNIENRTWVLDFNTIENLIWESNTEPLALNGQTIELLENITTILVNHNSSYDLNRLNFLIKQGHPEDGALITDLLKRYLSYKVEFNLWFENLKTATSEEQLLELNRSKIIITQLQNKHFGLDLAKKLFSQRNASTFLMIDKQINLLTTAPNNHIKEHAGAIYDTNAQ